jgi:hypothetical protein
MSLPEKRYGISVANGTSGGGQRAPELALKGGETN